MKTQNKVCFSYIRFSSESQKDGSSVERQTPIAQRVATEKGWTLREDLNASDLGVSAFKGDNIKTLRSIIDAVKEGKIPQGSVMVIEAFDRFSRQQIDTAEDILKEMLRAGLEIYVERGGHHLTRESLNRPIDRIIALLELASANEYSAKLSERVKAAYRVGRQQILNGEKVKLHIFPSWIDDNFQLNEKAGSVASIFTLYLAGKGPAAIAKEFNQKNVSSLRGTGLWSQAVIYKLLTDRKVIGEYNNGGEIVKGFFPSVVSDETFYKVQSRLNDNKGKRPTGIYCGNNIANIFSGVAFCSCGQKIKVSNGKGGKYITCHGHVKGLGCTEPMVKYDPFETSFVSLLRLRPEQLVRDESGTSFNAEIQILKGQLSETQKQISNITESLGFAPSKSLALRLASLEQEADELTRKIELASAKSTSAKGSTNKLNEIVKRLDTLKTDSELRSTVQSWIREQVNRITLNKSDKTFTIDAKNGRFIKMGLDGSIMEIKPVVDLMTQQTYHFVAVQQVVNS